MCGYFSGATLFNLASFHFKLNFNGNVNITFNNNLIFMNNMQRDCKIFPIIIFREH